MSNHELVGAYVEGAISRRTLIRRLVAAGVSLGAATAYAHHLAPKAAAKGSGPSEYPSVKLRILSETTEEIAKDKGVNVRVKTADPCELTLELRVEQGNTWYSLGVKQVTFGESGGKKDVLVKFSDAGDLNRKKKSRVTSRRSPTRGSTTRSSRPRRRSSRASPSGLRSASAARAGQAPVQRSPRGRRARPRGRTRRYSLSQRSAPESHPLLDAPKPPPRVSGDETQARAKGVRRRAKVCPDDPGKRPPTAEVMSAEEGGRLAAGAVNELHFLGAVRAESSIPQGVVDRRVLARPHVLGKAANLV